MATHDLFDIILLGDNMINNYMLGLFATDGSLQKYTWKSKEKITYSETLEMKDLDIIEQVADYFETTVNSRTRIINNKAHTFYKVEINSSKISPYVEYLKNNKENLYQYFVKLNKEQQNHFIRGAFDGDGGVCKTSSGKGIRCYFCANSKDNLDKIYEYWFSINNIKYSKYYDKRGAGAYNYNIGNQKEIEKFADLIYKNAKYKLNRKYKIFLENGLNRHKTTNVI